MASGLKRRSAFSTRLAIVAASAGGGSGAPASHAGGSYPGSSQTDLSPQGPLAVLGFPGSTTHSLDPSLATSSSWYSKRATSGAGAVSSQPRPFLTSSCGSRSPSACASFTAARRRRGSGSWIRTSITEVCRVCANSRAEPSARDG